MVRFHQQLPTTTTTCLSLCSLSDSSADSCSSCCLSEGRKGQNDYFSWHWVIGYIFTGYSHAKSFTLFFFFSDYEMRFNNVCDTWQGFITFTCHVWQELILWQPVGAEQGTHLDDKSITSIIIYTNIHVIIKTINSWDEADLPRKTSSSIISAKCQEMTYIHIEVTKPSWLL